MGDNKIQEFPVNSIRLCFDSLDGEACQGRILGIALKEEILFQGMAELIVQIDEAFNKIGQPQPYKVLRSFGRSEGFQSYKGNPVRYYTSGEIAAKKGKEKTFDLIMTSRHRAEWQGMIKDTDGKIMGRFETILECMQLLGYPVFD